MSAPLVTGPPDPENAKAPRQGSPSQRPLSTHPSCSTPGKQLALLDLGPEPSEAGDVDPLLMQIEPRGETYAPDIDRERLGRQLRQVLELMEDGAPRTLPEIAEHVAGAETALSARLRDLRRLGYRVESKRRGTGGLWEYRVAGRSA